ncbi:unnamed protein product [Sphenostylis stenocarpa]|uniref:Uncharacterized protein n=1 Tax=Sphenostylis stenocarpa TaxID=92480 RepID=A0AA86VN11_9FABA|nr:unnamed protein product [Sphenostylis stenocarpa]
MPTLAAATATPLLDATAVTALPALKMGLRIYCFTYLHLLSLKMSFSFNLRSVRSIRVYHGNWQTNAVMSHCDSDIIYL